MVRSSPNSAEIIHPYVERRPGVMGGRAIIRGTRLSVSEIVQDYHYGLSVEEILSEFPQLTPAQVYDALSFYHDHREEMDSEITAMSDISSVMQTYPPTLTPPTDDRR